MLHLHRLHHRKALAALHRLVQPNQQADDAPVHRRDHAPAADRLIARLHRGPSSAA
jgi:hypothetical protein